MAGVSFRLLVLRTRQPNLLRSFYDALGIEFEQVSPPSIG